MGGGGEMQAKIKATLLNANVGGYNYSPGGMRGGDSAIGNPNGIVHQKNVHLAGTKKELLNREEPHVVFWAHCRPFLS